MYEPRGAARRRRRTTRSGWSRATAGRSPNSSRCSTAGSTTRSKRANMSLDWLGPRLYRPSMTEVLTGALSSVDARRALHLGVPLSRRTGGFVSYLKPFFDGADDCALDHRLVRLDTRRRGAALRERRDGRPTIAADFVGAAAGAHADSFPARRTTSRRRGARWPAPSAWSSTSASPGQTFRDWHWTYFYDDDFCFSRISFPHMFAPNERARRHGQHPVRSLFL